MMLPLDQNYLRANCFFINGNIEIEAEKEILGRKSTWAAQF